MRRNYFCFILGLGFLAIAHEPLLAASKSDEPITRGKYLVDQVAMCVECHTPRNDKGELVSGKYLKGAPVPVKAPPYPNLKWAIKAPAIAGLTGYTKEQGVRLLTQGVTSEGRIPDAPMPRFRLTPADAAAIVDYLKSLE
jgi:mono/diheme cytochrome c family protein